MKRLSLTHRIFLITFVAVVPTIIIILLNLWTIRNDSEVRMHEAAHDAALTAALELERIIGGVEAVLLTVSATRVPDRTDCTAFLARVKAALPQLADVFIVDGAGSIYCSSTTLDHTVFVGDRSYYQDAKAKKQRVIGEYTEGRQADFVGLPVAVAMSPTSGIKDGVAVAMLDLGWLGVRLKERGVTNEGALTVADRNGRILTREPFPERFVGTMIPEAFRHLVTASDPGTMEVTSQDGTRRIIGYLPASYSPVEGLYVSAGISTAKGYALINSVTRRAVLIGTLGIATAFVLTFMTSNLFIRKPFRRLIDTIEAWQRNDTSPRTGLGDDLAEFGRAGRALDAFMDMLSSARAERRLAEQQRELLTRELDHRVKNLLSTVQAVARQTFRGAADDASRAFTARLAAMGSAHQLLMGNDWQAAQIRQLITATTRPFDDPKQPRFTLRGPQFDVDAKAAMALSMGLHELCTNAAKYGALLTATGHVEISWQLSGSPDKQFSLLWQERGGPPVSGPTRKGFGSTMIEQVMAAQIDGTVVMTYAPDGVTCRIAAPFARIGLTRTEPSSPPMAAIAMVAAN